ncbi:hypothetical protein WMY93_032325 [Mugilogobius chulae]|uniref:Uncharacterized protein n=1 Tax=Mugilogobius chulae TaxID=88201 RepID=A0AAW0MPJ6_9GOBI
MSDPVRAAWCQFCHQTPPGDLESLHQLEAILPEYEHTVCSYETLEEGGFKVSIKLKINEEQAVHQWLEAFQDSSKTTWRVLKTYPTIDRTVRNKYRIDLRCHQMRRRSNSKKNTSCPAVLYLILKRETFSNNRKSRSPDPHVQNHLTFHINIRNTHNHECSEALQHREVSQETVNKLIQLFLTGHSPTSAHKTLKCNLQEELGENYALALTDRSIYPDLHYCFRLYYKTFKRRCRKKELTAPWCFPSIQDLQSHSVVFTNQEQSPDISTDQSPSSPQEQDDLKIQLWNMCEGLLEKLKSNEAFLEPIKAMLSSYQQMKTDSEIISALHMFGRAYPTESSSNQLKTPLDIVWRMMQPQDMKAEQQNPK